MTDQLTALRELVAKVEAGNGDFTFHDCIAAVCPDDPLRAAGLAFSVCSAHGGSLDAAKALHEALLPEWEWCVDQDEATVYSPDGRSVAIDGGTSMPPARSWLIAILKAKITELEATQ